MHDVIKFAFEFIPDWSKQPKNSAFSTSSRYIEYRKMAGWLLGFLPALCLTFDWLSSLLISLGFGIWATCSINYSLKVPTSEATLPLKGQVILSRWKNFEPLKIQLAICVLQMYLALLNAHMCLKCYFEVTSKTNISFLIWDKKLNAKSGQRKVNTDSYL